MRKHGSREMIVPSFGTALRGLAAWRDKIRLIGKPKTPTLKSGGFAFLV